MAITYHAGRRIQGLSTEGFSTVTYSDDFSSDNWTDASATMGVSGGVLVWNFARNGVNNSTVYDLTSTSDTAWILRFKMVINNWTTGNESTYGNIVIGTTTQTTDETSSGDYIGLRMSNTYGGVKNWVALASNGSNLQSPTVSTNFALASATGTYYIQIKRTSSTSCTIGIYSDSAYTILTEQQTLTISSSYTGLRYIKLTHFNSSTSTAVFNGTIDDLYFYDGITSVVDTVQRPANVQVGSRFEETNTRKIYHRGIVTTPSLSKTDCVGYYTLDETSGNPANHVTTGNGFTDIPTQTIYYLAHGHDSTGRHFVKKVGSTVTTISESDWISLKGALTEAHTGGQTSALPSAWSGMWQGSTGSINGHGWYAISFSTDTNSPVNGSTGATQNITGKHGTCFEFSGGNNEQVGLNGAMMADYYYPTQHASTTHQADFAISCWINLSSNNTGYPSVISNYGGSNTGGFQFLLWGANTISFHTSTSAIHGSTVMSSGTWYHVVAMRESGYLKLYVNGSADGTPVANAHVIQAELDMAIGGKADGTAGFNGKIDDVSVWRRALTTTEISNLYDNGTVLTTGTSAMSWIEEGT